MAKEKIEIEEVARFDVNAIIQSDKYGRYADLLLVVLDHNKQYSHDEINVILQGELQRPVTVNVN